MLKPVFGTIRSFPIPLSEFLMEWTSHFDSTIGIGALGIGAATLILTQRNGGIPLGFQFQFLLPLAVMSKGEKFKEKGLIYVSPIVFLSKKEGGKFEI